MPANGQTDSLLHRAAAVLRSRAPQGGQRDSGATSRSACCRDPFARRRRAPATGAEISLARGTVHATSNPACALRSGLLDPRQRFVYYINDNTARKRADLLDAFSNREDARIRWSRVTPQFALAPAVSVTMVAFVGAICWTIYISFTGSRRFPNFEINPERWARQYDRLFNDRVWDISLGNILTFGVGSALAIIFGFVLAAMIEREKHGEDVFRTLFLYPLAVSLIVTGIVWRWLFNPGLGVERFLQDLGWESANFDWLSSHETAMYGIILAAVWQSSGFYLALMLAGLKSINMEIWSAAKLDGVSLLRLYVEIIIPMMKCTFLTCAILLSIGVVKAYDIIVATTNGGPGQSTWMPAYFTINAYTVKSNIAYASAAAVMMLLITFLIFLPLVALTVMHVRKRESGEPWIAP